jgi:hypothetical protein
MEYTTASAFLIVPALIAVAVWLWREGELFKNW